MQVILASGSPRRKELLSLLNIPFVIEVSDVEEVMDERLSPQEMAMSLALQKASAVAATNKEAVVLGADTIVTLEGRMLGKPCDPDEAKEMLMLLSGRTHEVFTGVALLSQDRIETFYERTEVTFYPLSDEDIVSYIATNEPFDKAGGYGIQGFGAVLVEKIQGDYYAVVGLPIAKVKRKLQEFLI